jgi:DNA-binding NarL/FixJ family response regulator
MNGKPLLVIVDRLGEANAETLASIAGGTRLCVPRTLNGARYLRQRVGDSLAALLVFHFSGQRLQVPRMAQSGPVNLREVIRLTRAGKSASSIARTLQCCDRAVYSRRAEARRKGLL